MENILEFVMRYSVEIGVAISTIVTVVVGIRKIYNAFAEKSNEYKEEIKKQRKENQELRDQLRISHQDNQELREELREVNDNLKRRYHKEKEVK